jgi:hypothetical protein
MLDKLEVGLLREPIIGFGTEPSQKASVPVIGKYGQLLTIGIDPFGRFSTPLLVILGNLQLH